MKVIIDFINNINICYLILNILLLLNLKVFLKYRVSSEKIRNVILIIVLCILILVFSYINGIVQNIFKLNYLSVKLYLLSLISTNIITIFTLNKKIKLIYCTLNYTLFIIKMIIFVAIIFIVLGNQFDNLYIMDISNAVTLIDLSFIIFMIYLSGMLLVSLGYYIYIYYLKKERIVVHKERKSVLVIVREKIVSFFQLLFRLVCYFRKKKNKKVKNNFSILTPEELLNYQDKSNFSIQGVDCSIIFEDSNSDNIVKNYYILLDDLSAKMVNGYTLEENKLLKSICMKLNISNLNQIDIYSMNILNRVSLEEYNFLKKIMEVQ